MTLCLTCKYNNDCIESDLNKISGQCEYYSQNYNPKIIKNCNNCHYSINHNDTLFCMGQKGMPRVQETESCDAWKSRNITNADKIRSMTDEKLSEWIVNILNKGCPRPVSECGQDCKLCWMYWLKSEVKGCS